MNFLYQIEMKDGNYTRRVITSGRNKISVLEKVLEAENAPRSAVIGLFRRDKRTGAFYRVKL